MNRIDLAHAVHSGGVNRTAAWLRTGVALFLLAVTGSVLAQTSVGGAISGSTTWTAAQSPYIVQSDISVLSGAVLRIQPGTVVRVANRAGITVAGGAIVAIGGSNNRITITSNFDDGVGGSPQPGDWGELRILAATNNAVTVIENADIRYGSGIVIDSASPTLRNVAIDFHDAPAITIDLLSSPQGDGLTAQGNTLNGIEVPAGQIDHDIVWALRGIPYVLRQGVVTIGGATFGFTPNRLNLALGASAILELALPDPAPAPNGASVVVESLAPSYVGLTTSSPVEFFPGQSTAQLTIEAISVSPQAVELQAHHPDYPTATARVRVVDLPSLQLTPDSLQLEVGAQTLITLSTTNPAPVAGLPVLLSTDCPACLEPLPDVSIPHGQTTTSFPLVAAAAGAATLIAEAEGHTPSQASIQVRQPFIEMPVAHIVPPQESRELLFNLSSASQSDVVVAFSAEPSALIALPDPVVVPAGQTQGSILLSAGSIEGIAMLTASAPGYESSSTEVHVREYQLSLMVDTPTLPQGFTGTVFVSLNQPAPPGGLAVQLEGEPNHLVDLNQQTVIIPAGQLVAPTLTMLGVEQGTVQLTASSPGVTSTSIKLTVVGPLRPQFSRPSIYIAPGLRSNINEFSLLLVYGSEQSPITFISPRPVEINLENSDPTKFLAPASIMVDTGFSRAYPRLEGIEITAGGVSFTASIAGQETKASSTVNVHVVEPTLTFVGLDNHRLEGAPRDDFRLRWVVPGASFPPEQVAASSVGVGIHEPDPANIVSGIYSSSVGGALIQSIAFPAGSTQSVFGYVGSPNAGVGAGTYRVRAQATPWPLVYSETQHVNQRRLVLSMSDATVASGFGYDCRIWVYRYRGNQLDHQDTAATVQITTTDAERLNPVNQQIVIPSGYSGTCVPVQVPGLPGGEPVYLQAENEAGVYVSSDPMAMELVAPTIRMYELGGVRELGSERQPFRVTMCTGDDSNYYDCGGLQLLDAVNVVLELAEMSAPAPVSTIHRNSDSEVVGGILIPQGMASSELLYVGPATELGQYRVRATATVGGGVVALSDVTEVRRPSFSLSGSTVVGRGMYSSQITLYPTIWNSDAQWYPPEGLTIVSSDPAKIEVLDDPAAIRRTTKGAIHWPIFYVKGLGLTEPNETVQLIASAPGFDDSEPLDMVVREPLLEIEIAEWADYSYSGGPRLGFYTGWSTENPYYPGLYDEVVPNREVVVDVELIDIEPPGLVKGIYDEYVDGTLIVQLVHGEWAGASSAGYVASPVLPPEEPEGNYRIRAYAKGFVSEAVRAVRVLHPDKAKLKANTSHVHVGVGLSTVLDELRIDRSPSSDVMARSHSGLSVLRFRCAAPTLCSIAEPIVLQPGQTHVNVQVQGLAVGSTWLLLESEEGAAMEPVRVTVSEPELRFSTIPQGTSSDDTSRVQLKVYPYVAQARFPRQAVIGDWSIDLRASSDRVRIQTPVVRISAGQTESPVFEMELAEVDQATLTASGRNAGIATTTLRRGFR